MRSTDFICPNCSLALVREGRVLRCETGHSFDLAREGYVNLLVGKRPAITGDSAAMIAARRR